MITGYIINEKDRERNRIIYRCSLVADKWGIYYSFILG
ncbi:hypothetical protein RUMOBE_03259 [Blautia obeum ATCC 29174]|uniref:Uncharacterized protein n=1 Tax=Blautia obeum ATCC 29174 TaxID=411459 RepID=A5ZW66_9FIRM|nr:hypothetical protein RUMOBE_03259 [Blautia obeum ATCC 29174]